MVEPQRRGGVCVRMVEGDTTFGRKARALAIADVRLRRLQRLPVSRHLESMRLHGHEVLVHALRARLHEQLLDRHLCRRVLALAEMVVPNPTLRVGEVQRRPVVVGEGAPDGVVVVDRDRVVDSEVARLRLDVVQVVLEAELGRVDADDGEPLLRYFAAQART